MEEIRPQVVVAKTAGFCFGVRKAVDMAYHEAGCGEVYTYGPIIHNRTVTDDLEKSGVHILTDPEALKDHPGATVIIRSHGVSRAVYERLEKSGARVMDATCPFVKRIHKIVEEHSAAGEEIVIVGNAGHPEVEAICGWSHVPAHVIGSGEEARSLMMDPSKKVIVVAQTTFMAHKFEEVIAILQGKGYNVTGINTICSATKERQDEAAQLASQSDAMIVIGDRSSSNSAKLFEICRGICERTFFIQAAEELNPELLASERMIGITAGASTPKTIIEEVSNHVLSGRGKL